MKVIFKKNQLKLQTIYLILRKLFHKRIFSFKDLD